MVDNAVSSYVINNVFLMLNYYTRDVLGVNEKQDVWMYLNVYGFKNDFSSINR